MLHHLMVGTWTPPGAIFTFVFDDEALTLKLIKKTIINHDEPISWMTFDHARKNIYGASMKTFSSYTVTNPTEIKYYSSHPIGGHPKASLPTTKTRAIFILAAKKPPYNVYANPFYEYAGYGNVFSVTPSGGMDTNIQNYEYSPSSAIHGMVFDPKEEYLYSADMWGDKVWAHRKDGRTGKVECVGSVDVPKPGDHPRWVEMHPKGGYLYVLMEAANYLAVYTIDPGSHMPVFTGMTYPLIPQGLDKSLYRADNVAISHTATYLFATSRANLPHDKGYISAFRLDPSGSVSEQLCMNPTPTSGGHSNAVTPCPWNDEWLALTDDQVGGVEVYRWKRERLERAARCELRDEPGFGMNAIWYD